MCADAGAEGAVCAATLTGQGRSLTPSEWASLRFGQVCMAPQNFRDWKRMVLKWCSDNNCVRGTDK